MGGDSPWGARTSARCRERGPAERRAVGARGACCVDRAAAHVGVSVATDRACGHARGQRASYVCTSTGQKASCTSPPGILRVRAETQLQQCQRCARRRGGLTQATRTGARRVAASTVRAGAADCRSQVATPAPRTHRRRKRPRPSSARYRRVNVRPHARVAPVPELA